MCDLHEVYIGRRSQQYWQLMPSPCVYKIRSSLLCAIGKPTDSLQFASHNRYTYRKETSLRYWSPTPCLAANKKYPEGKKVLSKAEFDL